ncbi:hypothetical protein B0H17DRAFT_1055235 [Mycena rosella]|uniref:F-box domain-containing protein n=1 Tax=Mycena rosella TaxID=1033263 RepID=A0AAD7DPR6_MYCRO|nr:hypothetical protein B0H17DRAFT_1055235 [Mycena rosella]
MTTTATSSPPIFPWGAPASLTTVPSDILQHVFSWASPSDLQALHVVCRVLQAYIDNGFHNWRAAFGNVKFSIPYPTLLGTLKLSTVPSLLFGAGKCMTCRRHTKSIPYSFALNIRFCSLACEFTALLQIPPTPKRAPALPIALPDLEHRNTLPAPLAYLEGSSDLRLYPVARVNSAWNRFANQYRLSTVVQMPRVTPAIQHTDAQLELWMATAELLCAGARRYRLAKEEVDQENWALLSQLAHELGYSMEQLVTSPTLARWVNLYAQDLQSFTSLAWKPIRDKAILELHQRTSLDRSQIVCSFYSVRQGDQPRRYSEEDLQRHFVSRHPDQVPAPISNGLDRCPLCPKQKTAAYDRRSMIKHVSKVSVLLTHSLSLFLATPSTARRPGRIQEDGGGDDGFMFGFTGGFVCIDLWAEGRILV